jgi:hypothetical protein
MPQEDRAQAERVVELRRGLSLVDVCWCLGVNAKEGLLLEVRRCLLSAIARQERTDGCKGRACLGRGAWFLPTVRKVVAAQARRKERSENKQTLHQQQELRRSVDRRQNNERRKIQRSVFSTADVPTTLLSHIDEGSFPSPTRGWLHKPDMGVLSSVAGMLSQGQRSVGKNSLARFVIRDDEAVREGEPVNAPWYLPSPWGLLTLNRCAFTQPIHLY